MHYSFLLLCLFLFLIPIFLLLDRRVLPLNQLKPIIFPSIFVAVVFSEIAVFFSGIRVWMYNPKYITGVFYRSFPIEGYVFILFFIFALLSIYVYLNLKFPNNDWQKYSLAVSHLMIGVCVAMLFFAYSKWYTLLTFVILIILLLFVEYGSRVRFMYRFYRAFLVCLVPFYICYGFICNLPIIQYQTKETVDAAIFNIPLENHFYMMAMFLLGVFTLELLKSKKVN